MKIIAIIPAHLKSVRLPRKIILKIHGLEMIEHVRRRALLCKFFDEVYVATDNNEIAEIVKRNNGNIIKTKKIHSSGTSRVIEACEGIEASHIVLIQGDEPLMLPDHLNKICESIAKNPHIDTWNATAELSNPEELERRSIVKCILNNEGKIIFCFRGNFSSSTFENQKLYTKKILGLIAFRKDIIMQFKDYLPSTFEISESIEQLRFIENNINLQSVQVNPSLPSINEYEDKKIVLDFIENNLNQKSLLKQILNQNK